jgi:hypothetical protein
MTGNYYGMCSPPIEVVEILSTECRGLAATATNWGLPDRSRTTIPPRKSSGWPCGAPRLHPGYPPVMLSLTAPISFLSETRLDNTAAPRRFTGVEKRKGRGEEGRRGATIRPIWAQGRAWSWATKPRVFGRTSHHSRRGCWGSCWRLGTTLQWDASAHASGCQAGQQASEKAGCERGRVTARWAQMCQPARAR